MPDPFDPMELALMDKTKVLRSGEVSRETTCCICGGPMSPGEWTVKIKRRDTHTHCAGGHGWLIS